MSFTMALILFLVVVFLYLLFIEIFTIIFMITGINESKARFQVISLVTNTGFTTEDSELIMKNRLRKKIAKFIMIFSYCFSVSVIAILVNFFTEAGNAQQLDYIIALCVFLVFTTIYILIKKVKVTKKLFYYCIEKLTKKLIYKEDENSVLVIEKIDSDKVFAKVIINIVPKDILEKSIEESEIKKKYSIQIISIGRNEQSIFPVKAKDTIQSGDILFVVGNLSNINLFSKNI